MSITQFIKSNPLTAFVLLTYLVSWSFLYPCYQMILNAEEGSFPPLALIGLIGAFGPSIVALIFTRIQSGRKGVKELLSKYSIWKVHWKYYLLVLLLPIVLQVLGVLISSLMDYEIGNWDLWSGVKNYLPYLLITIPFGPLAEELGWRGYFLPALLQKFSPVKASLIVGIVWTVWHLASFSFPGAAIPSAFEVNVWSLGFYTLQLLFLSLLFTYVFLHTRGSVLIAILFHAAFNANENIAFSFFDHNFEDLGHLKMLYVTFIMLLAGVVILILLQKGFKTSNSTLK